MLEQENRCPERNWRQAEEARFWTEWHELKGYTSSRHIGAWKTCSPSRGDVGLVVLRAMLLRIKTNVKRCFLLE